MKRSYHTDICLQYKLGLLDTEIQNRIPYTTLAYWRKKDFNQYFGMDGCFTDEKIELIRSFMCFSSKIYLNLSLLCRYCVVIVVIVIKEYKKNLLL